MYCSTDTQQPCLRYPTVPRSQALAAAPSWPPSRFARAGARPSPAFVRSVQLVHSVQLIVFRAASPRALSVTWPARPRARAQSQASPPRRPAGLRCASTRISRSQNPCTLKPQASRAVALRTGLGGVRPALRVRNLLEVAQHFLQRAAFGLRQVLVHEEGAEPRQRGQGHQLRRFQQRVSSGTSQSHPALVEREEERLTTPA